MSAFRWVLAIALCGQLSLLDGAKRAAGHGARRLWEREEPNAARGNALAAGGEVEKALEAYDAAEKTLPPEGPAAGALAHDRASALLKQGPAEAPRALAEANRALSSRDPATRALGAYDAALALEGAGNSEQAIAAYARALALDPADADSKVNLELLLREEERKKKQPGNKSAQPDQQQQQKPGDDRKQAQRKQQDQKGANEGEQRQARNEPQGKEKQDDQGQKEQRPGERAGEGRPEGQEARPQGQKPESTAQASAQPLDRTEAQRLLDALRGSEKNLQVWRFGKRARDPRRKEAVKDW
jgi:tetratricopeptide (TPR) repeat protein